MATLPEGLPDGVNLDTYLGQERQPTNTFIIDWSARQVSGMDAGLAAMRQAVDIILQTERFRWQIYSSDFGGEFADLAGEEYDYVTSEFQRRAQEALSLDKRILSVENFRFSEPAGDSIACSFDVVTVFGTFAREVVL